MPRLDYQRFDPWKKYEQTRDYLLRRAGLEEQRRQNQRNFSLQQRQADQFQDRTDLYRQQERRLQSQADRQAKVIQAQLETQQRKAFLAKMEVNANLLLNADKENWDETYKTIVGMYEKQTQVTGDSQELDKLKTQLPKEYDKEKVDGFIKAWGKRAEENNSELVLLRRWNKKEGKYDQKLLSHDKGEDLIIEAGWEYVNEAYAGAPSKKTTTPWGEGYSKGAVIDDTRQYYDNLKESYMDPEFPDTIREGPKNDPDRYRRLHKEASDMESNDFWLIDNQKKPKWMTGKKKEEKPSSPPPKNPTFGSAVLDALNDKFPNAPDGTVKYLGTEKYEKKNGEWAKATD